MNVALRIRERVVRQAPFGLRLWDPATGTQLIEGVEIDAHPRQHPYRTARAFVNPSGIYCVQDLPGLQTFTHVEADDPTDWAAALRGYRVTMRDPLGRFLPAAFDADLPVRGLLDPFLVASPPAGILPLPESPPSPPVEPPPRLPLFSAPSRPVPDAVAVVRAGLREFPSGRPAAWCLLQASIGGTAVGLGLADAEGRATILFPYPAPPKRTLTSPPMPRNDFRWTLTLSAYYRPRPADAAVPEIPDLADLLAQMDSPRRLLESLSPPQAMPPLPLEYGLPLTVRTRSAVAEESSFLFVDVT